MNWTQNRSKKSRHREMAIKMGTKTWKNSCWRKKSFTEPVAKGMAVQYNQRAYPCERCGTWHLTSNVGESSEN